MTWPMRLAAVVITTLAFASGAVADQTNTWSDKTTLSFDAPIMIPGATLPAGTYVFRLMDSPTNRHLVQIFNENETKLIATTQAVPTRREDPRGDVVVKMNPTEAGAPAAIKAWFYPGSLYGHEFVYSGEQARNIAERTKTLVLSTDVPGEDVQKGTLHVYDAEGRRNAWKEDAITIQEWNAWRKGRQATAKIAAPGSGATREATAPMVHSKPAGMTVRVDDLEENPNKYIGQTVSVTAEVEEVFGPRLFKIDEPGWADLDGEVLVYLPSNLAAFVREDDRVTITGTLRMLKHPEIEFELEWLEMDADDAAAFIRRPVLIANQIVGGNNNVALAVEIGRAGSATPSSRSTATGQSGTAGSDAQNRAAGTAGSSESSTGAAGTSKTTGTTGGTASRADERTTGSGTNMVTDSSTLRGADREMVGRQVRVEGVKVTRVDRDHGFWIETGGTDIFVLPVDRKQMSASSGQTVTVDGILLEMPRRLRQKSRDGGDLNDTVYIHARSVQ